MLVDIDDDGEYIKITQDIQTQLKNQDDEETLSAFSETTETVLTIGFVFSFIFNLVFKGVMGQLWIMFNTLQIIMVLRHLKVTMPANIVFFLESLDRIVNF